VIPRAGVTVEGLPEILAERLAAAVERAAKRLRCPGVGAEISGMDEWQARALNRKYRHKDRVAEVLSFSLPPSVPGGSVGEILVCPQAAVRRARGMGLAPDRWMQELCVHGYLHLLGFRHDDPESSGLMFSLQKSLLRR
jgi:probable rRNA maturation factor